MRRHLSPLKDIYLDGSRWKTGDDFYDSLFAALGSPPWHGRNFDALRDSIMGGQINNVEQPFVLYLGGTNTIAAELKALIGGFIDLINAAKAEGYDVEIVFRD